MASSTNKAQPKTPRALLALLAVFAAALALSAVGLGMLARERASAPAPSAIGGPFALKTGDGKTITDRDLLGEPFLVFFGYTHCPDVCPTTLAQISQVLNDLGPDNKLKVLFITVDPERDTPRLMQQYAGSFGPNVIGLSGDRAAIDKVMKEYRVYARKVPEKGGEYSMDHSAIIYLMGRDGKFLHAFNVQRPPEQAAAELRPLL
ncbi:SCO family protein [Rhodoblastus acidophilus]|uniref:SCO family protein n=1 Tax=Candidatus Rhodoblastus alkanivorans TaxID=2954117 RepID=A0ABS9ZAZ9_9HYPH|nr:SCO family protein [Candidatus Rhodoblastus alkanivorans]MCI4677755.1 SCO family protein [Candidatus Rhodoblastus alkanivorans]MCI4684747.1 SCO family protein [Candidatus Rhodoblastus alkanivorans]MDI4642069.1 SCO family protein [Rhodoblastus acidophilus]